MALRHCLGLQPWLHRLVKLAEVRWLLTLSQGTRGLEASTRPPQPPQGLRKTLEPPGCHLDPGEAHQPRALSCPGPCPPTLPALAGTWCPVSRG